MKRSIWSLVLCAGLGIAALMGTRAATAGHPGVDAPQPASVCASEAAEPVDLMCGKCGDNYCNPSCGETATSCPRDCGVTS